jgi:uncharacterized LabA/DUF88 family protein
MNQKSVAIYWDFENLHAGLLGQQQGHGSYLAHRFKPQEVLVDVVAVAEFALSLGPLAINRAFANWVSFNRYRAHLLQAAVELIQVFPAGANAKNGADIKLCLDVMDDMARFPHITTFVVVGGDSDYMPLSSKVKAAGRRLVGIGGQGNTNAHWARSCHAFHFYESLIGKGELPMATPVPAVEDPHALVRKAIVRLVQSHGGPWVNRADIRAYIQRMAPTFHESHNGFATFDELLASMGDGLETRQSEHRQEIRLRLEATPGVPDV